LLLNTNGPITQLDGAGNLVVLGTAGKDRIAIRQQENGLITATVNGELTGAAFAGVVNSIIVNGNDGDDRVTVEPVITVPVKLFGGGGADDLLGAGGDNRLDGGPGQDTLRSRSGVRDVFVLTAGQGTDRVKGFEADIDHVELSGDLVFTDVAVSQ